MFDSLLTVCDRFVCELSSLISAAPAKEHEARIEHVLRGSRCLKLRVYPETELETSSEFVQQMSAFFANAHGHTLKCVYAETLTSLLHPIVETATAEVNHPMWSKAITAILQRALDMATKPKYWAVASPLIVVALGVSPRDVLMQHWQVCIDGVSNKLKVSASGIGLLTFRIACFDPSP